MSISAQFDACMRESMADLSTPAEANARIDSICRDDPGLREKAANGHWTVAERRRDGKLDAVCHAFERLHKLDPTAKIPYLGS